jgi:hypothetical protein
MNGKVKVNVGDKIICGDEYRYSGFISGEIIEIIPYKPGRYRLSKDASYEDNMFGVTILGKFRERDFMTDVEYEFERRVYSCDFALNPIYDVNVSWLGYQGYAKALFFTSQELKDEFYDGLNKKKMEYHLNSARSYGWEG